MEEIFLGVYNDGSLAFGRIKGEGEPKFFPLSGGELELGDLEDLEFLGFEVKRALSTAWLKHWRERLEGWVNRVKRGLEGEMLRYRRFQPGPAPQGDSLALAVDFKGVFNSPAEHFGVLGLATEMAEHMDAYSFNSYGLGVSILAPDKLFSLLQALAFGSILVVLAREFGVRAQFGVSAGPTVKLRAGMYYSPAQIVAHALAQAFVDGMLGFVDLGEWEF